MIFKRKYILILLIIIVFLSLSMKQMSSGKKVVVFDFDETLGHFTELGYFCEGLENILGIELTNEDMITLIDIYPEFLRPNILTILNYLKKLKSRKICDKVMIYTNNQGPASWVDSIKTYFEYKLNYKLFDRVILAFKIGNRRIELNRTSHDKKLSDFFKCTKLPIDSEISFIDDRYHPEMTGDNVYYIQVKPYDYTLYSDEMIDRLFKSKLSKKINDKDVFRRKMTNFMKGYQYIEKTDEEYEIDKIVSKKIMENLQMFFANNKLNKTLKKRKNKDN